MPRPAVPGALALVCAAVAFPLRLDAQAPPLVLPKASPRAAVSQTIGLTEVTITYDRPAVNGREIWGELVPYNSVWRAGANENTVIAFSSAVRVGGKELPAGRYGVHMIPTAGEWTVILSRQANAWGSFSYDPKEDAVRLTADPGAVPFQERLGYTLDDPGTGAVTATMRWEKLAVRFTIEVDQKQVVVDSLRQQLRGLGRFFWQPWAQAAAWCVGNDVNLAEASTWTENSIAIDENFTNLRVKAALLEKAGDTAAAATLRGEASRWPPSRTSTPTAMSCWGKGRWTPRSWCSGRTSRTIPGAGTSTTAWARPMRSRATSGGLASCTPGPAR